MLTQAAVRFEQTHAPVNGALPCINSRPKGLFDSAAITGTQIAFPSHGEIYGEGEPAEYIYKVVSGAVRSYKILDDGRRQIGAFYMPGDIFGLEAGQRYRQSADAVCKTSIVAFKRSLVAACAQRDNQIAYRLWECTARELERSQDHALLLIHTAQERVAFFLLHMAKYFAANEAIELPMSRQDIADYLGLTIETVSRTLTQLEAQSAIALPTSRRIVLRNHHALNRLNA